jgi:enoyl-CoA hydratase/carnithine racemase
MAGRGLQVTRTGGRVELDLPGGRLTMSTVDELVAALTDVVDDDTVRVVVVGARGPDFCTGLDAGLASARLSVQPAEAIAAVGVPVVFRLRGAVHSGGLELALAGDVRIAAPDATFALADVYGGALPCWGGTQRLPRLIGVTAAGGMLLLGDRLDAAAAVRCGLVTRLAADPAAEVEAVCATLESAAPLALRFAKEAVTGGAELDMAAGMQLEADLNSFLQLTEDRDEGLSAFFARRRPSFRGR